MRKLLALVAFFFVLASPALADNVSGQCSIDKTVVGAAGTYVQCPFGDTNDYLIDQGYVAARLEADVRLSQTPIYAHDLCRYTDARGLDTDPAIFIPFATKPEYQSFIDAPPAHIDVVECCLPRNMLVKDVPEPTDTCYDNLGNDAHWVLESLVDPNTMLVIARPSGTSPNDPIVLTNGTSENPDYPITGLPIERDNTDSVLPKGTKISDYYIGRFVCSFGKKPVEYDLTALPNQNSVTPTATSRVIGDREDVPFRLICRDADWTPITPDFCEEGQVGSTYQDACTNGQSGVITKRIVHTCPDRTLVVQTLSNTCADCANRPPEVLSTTHGACPDNQAGTTTITVTRTYSLHGTQCVPTDTTVTDTSNCGNCPADQTQPDETQACPAGQSGIITYGVVRHYHVDSATHQCVSTLVRTLKSNTCAACATRPPEVISTTHGSCPANQSGQTTITVTRTYSVNGTQCVATDTTTTDSSGCSGCPADQDQADETQACPAGQSGIITYGVVRHYTVDPATHQCVSSLVRTLKSNTCAACATRPPEVISTTHGSCPVGQSGQTTITVTRTYSVNGTQCVPTDTTTTDSSGCSGCPADQDQADETQACPAGQSGIITYGVVRHYTVDPSTHQCVSSLVRTLKSNTCAACATRPPEVISTTHGACPVGQSGQTTITVTRTYSVNGTQCVPTDTTTTDSSGCSGCPADQDQADETQACPAGQSGIITYSVVRHYTVNPSTHQCVSSLVRTLKSNTCAACASKPAEVISTTHGACPVGQGGQTTITVTRTYSLSGTQCVSTDTTTTDSSGCSGCPADQDQADETQACPAGKSGIITYSVVRHYTVNPSTHQCVSSLVRTLKSNTCAACASKPAEVISTTHGSCPANQSGQTTITVTRTYSVNGTQCVATDTTTTDSSGCSGCPADQAQDDQTQACPTGQSGSIVYGVVRHYTVDPGTHQCVSSLVTTLKSNSCAACASKPAEVISTTHGACAANQSGQTTITVTRTYSVNGTQCVPTDTTTTDSSGCGACPGEQTQPDQTQACPSGQSGLITYSVVKRYGVDWSTHQCVGYLVGTLKSNTCAACNTKPDEKVNEYRQACLAGQSGYYVIGVFNHYTLSGSQCVTSQYSTVEWSNCAVCSGTTALEDQTEQCPVGQSGSIIYGRNRVSTVNTSTYACESHIDTYLKSNTCHATCIPQSMSSSGGCGSGQGGSYTYQYAKTCDANGNLSDWHLVSSSNNCYNIGGGGGGGGGGGDRGTGGGGHGGGGGGGGDGGGW